MTMPNFLVVGAQKAGTTALYHYLAQHPEIYMSPVKEPHFFAFEGEKLDFRGPRDQRIMEHLVVNDLEAYRKLFDGATKERAIGEASAEYLYREKVPGRIRRYAPEAKLIAVLRNPAERAYSGFLHLVRDGRETITDFNRALDAEEERVRNNWSSLWHYTRLGFYHAQLSRYYEAFERGQIRIYLYEDLKDDPVGMLRDIYGFLGVEDTFVPDVSGKYNVSGVPKNERLHALHALLLKPHPVKSALKPFLPKRFRRRLVTNALDALRNRNLVKPSFPVEARRRLIEVYREDILKLQDLIGRDLSAWLREPGGGDA